METGTIIGIVAGVVVLVVLIVIAFYMERRMEKEGLVKSFEVRYGVGSFEEKEKYDAEHGAGEWVKMKNQ